MRLIKRIAWNLLWCYGESCYRLGRDAGYHWALRAMCNWCGWDWYGEPTEKVFDKIGWIRF